ncbi:precursor of CEP14-like [Humulus lupulus]|uniref:precursor of CEP14-like n=1 Tax=Humulus lupulus TaxID=3486 RepID=UPI002B411E85|nr:precursor of CEP14-like [Humulus lupulus]
MARLSTMALISVVIFFSLVWSSEAGSRKLLVTRELMKKERVLLSSNKASLFLSALPKGTVPSSAPSKKGHAEVVNEKLIGRHLIAQMDRSLQSVPSPGVGH